MNRCGAKGIPRYYIQPFVDAMSINTPRLVKVLCPRLPYPRFAYPAHLQRATLPLQLHLPARRVACGGVGGARQGTGLRRAGDYG